LTQTIRPKRSSAGGALDVYDGAKWRRDGSCRQFHFRPSAVQADGTLNLSTALKHHSKRIIPLRQSSAQLREQNIQSRVCQFDQRRSVQCSPSSSAGSGEIKGHDMTWRKLIAGCSMKGLVLAILLAPAALIGVPASTAQAQIYIGIPGLFYHGGHHHQGYGHRHYAHGGYYGHRSYAHHGYGHHHYAHRGGGHGGGSSSGGKALLGTSD
jgi:hypothetical protein